MQFKTNSVGLRNVGSTTAERHPWVMAGSRTVLLSVSHKFRLQIWQFSCKTNHFIKWPRHILGRIFCFSIHSFFKCLKHLAFYEVTDFTVAVRLFILMHWASCGAPAVMSQIIIGKQGPQQLFTEISIQIKILTIYKTYTIHFAMCLSPLYHNASSYILRTLHNV